jgi:hypothetical protein
MPRLALLALLPALFACAPARTPYARLPPDAMEGAGDPTRAAIFGSAAAFSAGLPAGRPGEAARAAAQVEYLATEIPVGPRWVAFSPIISMRLGDARSELRQALGIAPDAPPQAVVDALYAASRALRSGDQVAAARALPAPVFTDGGATLVRLAAPPPLPRTQMATALTQQELIRTDQDNMFGGFGGGRGS